MYTFWWLTKSDEKLMINDLEVERVTEVIFREAKISISNLIQRSSESSLYITIYISLYITIYISQQMLPHTVSPHAHISPSVWTCEETHRKQTQTQASSFKKYINHLLKKCLTLKLHKLCTEQNFKLHASANQSNSSELTCKFLSYGFLQSQWL